MVSYSSTNENNIVVCEPNDTVKSFLIYKETSIVNQYVLLGTLSDTNYVYEDTNTYTQAVKYTIRGINDCGDTSLFSEPHKTIHLQSNLGVGGVINLSWNAYEGFTVNTYNVWRNGVLLGSVSGSFTTYTDYNPLAGLTNYQIEVVKSTPCEIPSKKKGTITYASTYSNKINVDKSAGIVSDDINVYDVNVYPNPTIGKITIDYGSNYNALNDYTIKITNTLGQTVYSSIVNKQTLIINLNSWICKGIYFVHLIDVSSNIIEIKKIILQ